MTDRTSAFELLAAASSAMIDDHHPADVLSRLVVDCRGPLSAEWAAIMVTESDGALNLLSESSQQTAEIELLQAQQSRGPCIDAIRSGEHVFAAGVDELVERWDEIGTAIHDAGFGSVHAFPMRWHGRTLGGLSVFRESDEERDPEGTASMGQAFADAATLVLLQVSDVSMEQVAERVREAVLGRAAVEQAKGVLAYLRGTDPEAAYEELLRLAAGDHGSLTGTALKVVRDQYL